MATYWGNYSGQSTQSNLISLLKPKHFGNCVLGLCADPAPDYSGPAKVPGSAIHVLDPRLGLLATLIPGLFTAKTCLDIGCNAGGVSCQLGKWKDHPCVCCKRL
jgi:7SK snRNA methylphosphate capping enzyme